MKKLLTPIIFAFALQPCPDKTENQRSTEFCETQAVLSNINETDEPQSNTQELNLYWLRDLEEEGVGGERIAKKVGFVSLSDVYIASEHKDSLAIPNLQNVKDKNLLQYFKLENQYRKTFLEKTGISETDSVFVYDYAMEVLHSFLVKNLNVVANLNLYTEVDGCPYDQHDYMIGFEINKKLLGGLEKYYSNVLVFVGKENPFISGQMKAIVWKKIKPGEFPLSKGNLPNNDMYNDNVLKEVNNALKNANAYLYTSAQYQYYVRGNQMRHLIIINKKTGELVVERLFRESESTSPAPLNFGIENPENPDYADYKNQWTGRLFKNKPEVIFGFEYVSFGCPVIIFLQPQQKDIYINCDNRH